MTSSIPSAGLGCIHLFYSASQKVETAAAVAAIEKFNAAPDMTAVTVSMLGHKADLCVMALAPDLVALRAFQTDLAATGLLLVDSYVSLTEVSEYAEGIPEQMRNDRLYPNLPPADMSAWCFYPMSKRRNPGQNWYTTDFDTRKEMMMGHGKSGRTFRGRIIQLITGSTGLDDHEWGVTLFGVKPDDLKDAVYTMRFDEASADYAEFGTFYIGTVSSPAAALEAVGL